MKSKIIYLIVLFSIAFLAAGCFETTEERVANLGQSIDNIALDGDGIN